MIALLLALGQAHAVDADGDLYPNLGVVDCDDDDPQVNPAASEYVDDGVDDDCDGNDALRRWFMVDKFASSGWTTTGNVVFAADTIELKGEMLGASASRNLTVQGNGHVYAALDVEALTGTCHVSLTTNPVYYGTPITETRVLPSTGTFVLDFGGLHDAMC